MTDDEIIKYMQCVIGNEVNCSECTYQKALPFPSCRNMCAKNALALINRQKAEIERVEKEAKDKERAYNDEFCLRKEWQTKCRELLKDKQTTKFEAIKEFAERVKEKLQWDVEFDNKLVFESDIDNLVKEMTMERGD